MAVAVKQGGSSSKFTILVPVVLSVVITFCFILFIELYDATTDLPYFAIPGIDIGFLFRIDRFYLAWFEIETMKMLIAVSFNSNSRICFSSIFVRLLLFSKSTFLETFAFSVLYSFIRS